MKPGTREGVMTVEEVVREAAHLTDPEQASEGVTALIVSFEGDERPATAAEDLAGELRSAAGQVDPEFSEPAVAVTAATAHWLATNPGDADDPQRAVREGARLHFGDEPPPEAVTEWLDSRGLS